jgi:hypothetical protein
MGPEKTGSLRPFVVGPALCVTPLCLYTPFFQLGLRDQCPLPARVALEKSCQDWRILQAQPLCQVLLILS